MRSEESRKRSSEATKKWYQDNIGLTSRSHGLSKTRAWKAWHNMKQRVSCPSNKDYGKYRHITIDPLWNEFLNFYRDMGDCPELHTLDRIDGRKGYAKSNCRWATPKQQARNRRDTRLTVDRVKEIKRMFSKYIPGVVIANKFGVAQSTICDIRHGRTWSEVSYV